jgi:hypothetical protein
MATETVNLCAQDGAIVGTAEVDSPPPTLLASDDGRMFVLFAMRLHGRPAEYTAAIPVAVIVKPAGT